MSGSTHAMVVYGADLGHGEDILLPGEVGYRTPEALIWTKLAELLPPGKRPKPDGYEDCETAVFQHLRLSIIWHGTNGHEMILAVEVEATVSPWESWVLNLDQMSIRASQGMYEQRIRDALVAIGLDPSAYSVGWTLALFGE